MGGGIVRQEDRNGMRRPRRALIAAAVALLLATSSCKGGGSGSDVVPCTNLSFTPAITTPAAGDVYLQGISSTCDSIDLSVVVSNLSGLFTVSFDLAYPAALLSYQSYFQGSVMLQESPVSTPMFIVSNPSPGTLQVTMTRLPPDGGVAVSGVGTLITVRFARVASGSGTVDFDSSLSSSVAETIYDSSHNLLAASFGPGHGGIVLVP